MRINTFVCQKEDVDACADCPEVREVLIEPSVLAKRGTLSLQHAVELAHYARTVGLEAVLVWDILMCERTLEASTQIIRDLDLRDFKAIRVTDLGALNWLMEWGPAKGVHLNCENGNNNIHALMEWCSLIRGKTGKDPERILLSLELPESILCKYCRAIPAPLEYLGVGPIEVFYSPRRLLDAGLSQSSTTISSRAARNRSLRLLQTDHGTVLYLDRDQFVIDRTKRLREAGLHTMRVDLRDGNSLPGIETCSSIAAGDCRRSEVNWPRRTQAHFFRANATTRQFEKLKSERSRSERETAIAEVIAFEKERFVAFKLTRECSLRGPFRVWLPTREDLQIELLEFFSVDGRITESGQEGRIVMSPWIPRIQPGALLFEQSSAIA